MPTELEIRAELLKRKLRSSFTEWCKLCGHMPAKHHQYIIDRIEEAVKAKINKLSMKRKVMIMAPPGSAKSSYTSVDLPPWFLALEEGLTCLACSHTHELSEGFGRAGRNNVDAFGPALGVALKQDSKAADAWELDNRSRYRSAGVGAGIAGFRADLGLIDDYFGKKEDAASKLQRDKIWSWYNSDFLTRLKPGALQIIICTPWHEDDLIHRILQRESDEWLVIRLPFYAEADDVLGRQPGERLWPEYLRDDQYPKDPTVAQALFQLRPAAEEGNFFKKEWLQGYEIQDLPNDLRIYVASDHAVSERQSADLTCLLPAGVDSEGNVYILPDVFWKISPADETVEAMVSLAKRRKPLTWWAEKGHISASIGPFLRKRLREQNAYVNIEEVRPTRDKVARAQSIQGRMSMQKVFFPKFAPWWGKAEHEMLAFPAGKHDDFVDALAHLGMGLDKMMLGEASVSAEVENLAVPFRPTMKWLSESEGRRKYDALLNSLDR